MCWMPPEVFTCAVGVLKLYNERFLLNRNVGVLQFMPPRGVYLSKRGASELIDVCPKWCLLVKGECKDCVMLRYNL